MRRALVLLFALTSCREQRAEIRAEHVPLTRAIASALPPPTPPPPLDNPELDCWGWMEASDKGPAPFPHPIHPGLAMGIVLDWADLHHEAKHPSIPTDSVSCPRARCLDGDDCWFNIRLEDFASTADSHLVRFVEVHAETGHVRWKDVGPTGEWIDRTEPPPRRIGAAVR